MYRGVVCDSALSLPGNYKAHVRMYHGNERSNNRIFPPLKNNSLPSIEEEHCSSSGSETMSLLQWPLSVEEYKTRDGCYGTNMLGVMVNISRHIIRAVVCVRANSWNGR